jgi:hypothetical protein
VRQLKVDWSIQVMIFQCEGMVKNDAHLRIKLPKRKRDDRCSQLEPLVAVQ